MDSTPSPRRFPASPPDSYCSSEASSLDYPSPLLVADYYGFPSLYRGPESACSTSDASLDTDSTFITLENMTGQSKWASAFSVVPVVNSSQHDLFGSLGSQEPMGFSHDIYGFSASSSRRQSHDNIYSRSHRQASLVNMPSPDLSQARLGSMPPSSQPSASFGALQTSVPNPHTPSMPLIPSQDKLDTHTPKFDRVVEISPFPSPRSIHGQVQDVAPYPSGPASMYGPSQDSYLGHTLASTVWETPAVTMPSLEPFLSLPLPASHLPGSLSETVNLSPDQRVHAVAAMPVRTRKPARRLTTREEANFQCQVKGCGKLFSRSYNYKAHMETHDEQRQYPFSCIIPNCHKRFVRRTDLQRHHQSVHMKERNHKCDYCGRLFARRDTLRRHMDDGCSKRFDIGTVNLRSMDCSNMVNGSDQGNLWRGG